MRSTVEPMIGGAETPPLSLSGTSRLRGMTVAAPHASTTASARIGSERQSTSSVPTTQPMATASHAPREKVSSSATSSTTSAARATQRQRASGR
jgi:hypothetical protein